MATLPPLDPNTEEVRVAMALNGGVSLAVWMGGCAVELDCARRAHLAPEETVAPASDGGPPPPPRRVYAGLCSALRRELVVDIMSGSSAGGINGALMAAAMTSGRRLDADVIRGRWLQLGDFLRLLHPLSTPRPEDLMNGPGFYTGLLSAFRRVTGVSDDPDDAADIARGVPPVAPAPFLPALDITTTDLAGDQRTFRDRWGLELGAREYRARFEFRRSEDYQDPVVLAGAARSSASFPVAFVPFQVTDPRLLALAGFDTPRWVVDGGLLDNAPIQAALELIPARPATRQVRRYLAYVNPDPNNEGTVGTTVEAETPALKTVVGAIVNLPRNAPFASQLEAIERASRRSDANAAAQVGLLAEDLDTLHAVADSLLRAYRRRRRLRGLQELLGGADGQAVFDKVEALGPDAELPWIPSAAGPPPPLGWRWGILAARRIHHLALDLLRPVIREGTPAQRAALLEARRCIDERAAALVEERDAFGTDPAVLPVLRKMASEPDISDELAGLACYVREGIDLRLRAGVMRTARDLYAVAGELGSVGGVPVRQALFGVAAAERGGPSEAALEHFLRRVLAVEVVRRAFASGDDVEDSQPLDFVQLTPYAPDLLFSATPLSKPPAPTPRTKLTGTELGHFGGFYRASWRANDFLWGRLDAAARIVTMLTSPTRVDQLGRDLQSRPARDIAAMVLHSGATPVERWLVEEALADYYGTPPGERPAAGLEAALEEDLAPDAGHPRRFPRGELARAVCIRAAQLEIVCHELPVLVEEAAGDEALGSTKARLELPPAAALRDGTGVRAAIEALREGDPLPVRLGRDDRAEHTSDLAVATSARAGLVMLALLRGARVPMAVPAQSLRAFLLPLAGAVSRHWAPRLTLLAAFWAAALLLAVRFVTLPDEPGADLGHLSVAEAVTTVIALLVVAGVAGLPGFRAVAGGGARAVQGLWAAGLVATGAGVVIALAWLHYSPSELVVADTDDVPPGWVLALPILLVLGRSAMRVPFVGERLAGFAQASWRGWPSVVFVLAVSGIVAGFAIPPLLDEVGDGDAWRRWAALTALVAAPLIGALYLFARRSRQATSAA